MLSYKWQFSSVLFAFRTLHRWSLISDKILTLPPNQMTTHKSRCTILLDSSIVFTFQGSIQWVVAKPWTIIRFALGQIWPAWTIWWTVWVNSTTSNTKERRSNAAQIVKIKLIRSLSPQAHTQIAKHWFIVKNFALWPKDCWKNAKGRKRNQWKGSIQTFVPN